ncbi:MAG: beta-ketoacyl synthase N-terminal-like domain-containing protein [Thermoanaerobaculia bacterium]
MKAPVITGVGAVTALGRDIRTTRDALAAGRSAIAPIVEAPLARVPPSPAARIGPFTTDPELPKARARRLDLGSQYAIVAARQCLADGRYEMAGREERTGILLGTGSAGAGPLTEFERQMATASPDLASPFLFPNTVANAPASQTALELKIKGPNVTLIQKDPGALNALFYGRMLLADGRADALLVGAADEWNLIYHQGYERVRATRTAERKGFALAEGAGLILVEVETSARARGASLYARVGGVGWKTMAMSPHKRRADPEVLEATMLSALEEAGLSADGIGLVSLSANGTVTTDQAEREALEMLFGARGAERRIAIKEQLGENPCVGAMQLALGALALSDEPALGAVLVNSFGAGGNFFSVVLTAPG